MGTRSPASLIERHYHCPFKFTGISTASRDARSTRVHGSEERVVLSARANRMNKLLAFAGIAEAATGAALVIAPSLVARLLLGAELAGVSIPIARVTGIALIGLGVACWPGPALVGMLTYNASVTLYLLYVGVRREWAGPLLWSAVAVHAGLAVWLALDLRRDRRLNERLKE